MPCAAGEGRAKGTPDKNNRDADADSDATGSLDPAAEEDAAFDATAAGYSPELYVRAGALPTSMKRTSVTHPLQIATVAAGPNLGRVGVTFCPGQYDPHAATGGWNRDLATDLDVIREWGAAAVITLLEPKEMMLLRVERLGEEVSRRNMAWFHLPIVDMSVPDEQFEREWAVAGERLRALMREGKHVLVHCRGGLGRTGTVAARLLVELGVKPLAAINIVREVRPGAIETKGQERYILGLRPV